MTLIPGFRVIDTVVPTDSAATYPSHDSIYGMGGWREVADSAARNAIPDTRRRQGMIVNQNDTGDNWQLDAAPWVHTDADWTLLASASLPGGADTQIQFNDLGAFNGSANFTIINDEMKAAFIRLTSALTFDSESTQALAVNTNNLPAPTTNGLRLDITADCDLTGIDRVTLTNDMTLLLIVNVGTNTLTLKNQDSGSTASNRFLFDADLLLTPDNGCVLLYDLTTLRWRLVGKTAGGLPGGSNTQVQFNNSGAFGGSANLTFDGTSLTALNSIIGFGGSLSFSAMRLVSSAANQNDFNTLGRNLVAFSVTAGAITMSGIDPTSFPSSNPFVYLMNSSSVGGRNITLLNEDAGSTAANRFILDSSQIVIPPANGVVLVYDNNSSRWRLVGKTAGANGTETRGVTNVTAVGTTILDSTHNQVNIDATAGNITISIPTATSVTVGTQERVYRLKRVDFTGNTVTIQRSGSDTFITLAAGVTNFTMIGGDSFELCGDSANTRWTVS